MNYRLWNIFYVFALVAAAMATFGPPGGIFAAPLVFGFWIFLSGSKPRPTLLGTIIAAFIVLILIAMLLPAVQSGRQASRRNQCMNHLKQIMIALLNYHDVNKTFPPAFLADANGKPMHSWRVLILPYIEERLLFNKYNFNEPWDGPYNSQLASHIPHVYRCPGQENDTAGGLETNYFAIVAPKTGWGRNLRQFTDGTSKTIMVIEATGLGVNWMEPRDVTLDEAIELLTTKRRSGHTHVKDGFLTTTYYETSFRNVAYCDGHVEYMGQLQDDAIAQALITAAGGERLNFDDGELKQKFVGPKRTTIVKWGKVWSLSVFVILTLLPVAWLKRQSGGVKRVLDQKQGDADEQEVGVVAEAKEATRASAAI